MKKIMSNEEKKRLSYERQNAVRQAWKEERSKVCDGIGTRKWTADEQEELINRGAVRGYEGHHMKSVSLYPEYAGNSNNIQFLNEEEHLYGAHKGNYHILTNGYYDPETGIMNDFGDELGELPVYDLGTYEKIESINSVRADYYIDAETQPFSHSENGYQGVKDSFHDSEETDYNCDGIYENKGSGFSNGRR